MGNSTINLDAEAVEQFIRKMRGFVEQINDSIRVVGHRTQIAGEVWKDGPYEKVSECINEIIKIVNRFNEEIEVLNKKTDDIVRFANEYHQTMRKINL